MSLCFYIKLFTSISFFFITGIRTFLLDSEEHECPDCNERDVSPETLIPNRFLRNAVMNFKNETGYAKRQTYPAQNTGQTTTVPTDQLKIETQQVASHVSSQAKTVPSSVTPDASPQEPVEQSTNLESASQHFPINISGSQSQSSTSKYLLLTDVVWCIYN